MDLMDEYKQLLISKQRLEEQIRNLETDINSIGAKPYDTVHGGTPQSRASKIASLVDLKNKYDGLVSEINAKIRLLLDKMEAVKNKEVNGSIYFNILHFRIIDQMTYEEIAVLIQYSYRQTRRLAKRAFVYLEETL